MMRSEPTNLTELFSYRLNRLSRVSSRIASHVNEAQYGIGSRDWRIIGLLGAYAPLSLNALAQESDLDKSQASRSVSQLIERGLVKSTVDELDGRGVRLDLTAKGRAMYRKAFQRAITRNEKMLAVLTEQERTVLERAVNKLTGHTETLLDDLKFGSTQGKASRL